mgnify:CR=1 FL=1
MKRTPCAASASRILVVVAGSLVDRSTTIAPLRAPERDAIGAEDDFLDLRRAGDAKEDDVGATREVGVGLHFLGALREQIFDRRAIAVRANRQRITLGDQVLRDAVAHEPDATMKPIRGLSMRFLPTKVGTIANFGAASESLHKHLRLDFAQSTAAGSTNRTGTGTDLRCRS